MATGCVNGDVAAIHHLAGLQQADLIEASRDAPPLIVGRCGVGRALDDYANGRVTDSEFSRWAWFLRRGFLPHSSTGPVSGIVIGFIPGEEDLILEVLNRTGELGDTFDGRITSEELEGLARRLDGSSVPA